MGCFASKESDKHPTSNTTKVTSGKSRITSTTNTLGTSNKPSTNEKVVSQGYRLDDSTGNGKQTEAGSASEKVAQAAQARFDKAERQRIESKDRLKAQAKISKSEKGL